jgi:hypothetical protein
VKLRKNEVDEHCTVCRGAPSVNKINVTRTRDLILTKSQN